MNRALKAGVITALGIALAILVFAGPAERESHSGQNLAAGQSTGQTSRVAAGAVVVHSAFKYDVSRPLASMRESADATVAADCAGAGCGTSPGDVPAGDPDAQERREEPIPPPTPAPTLTPE